MIRDTLIRIVAFLLVGVLLVVALNTLSQAYPPRGWDQILLARIDTVSTDPESIEVLVLGSSHAGAVDPQAMDRGSLVFPFPWNDLAEANFQARTMVPRLPELRMALVTVSWFTFHWSNDVLDDDALLDSRRTFHAVAPGWGTVEGDLSSLVRGKMYWIARRDHWYEVVDGLQRGGMDVEDLGEHLEEVRTDSALVEHARERVPHTLDRQREIVRLRPGIVEENYERMRSLVQYLRGEEVCVVLYTPPFFRAFRELYRGEPSRDEMEALMERLTRELDVVWLDYSDHPMGDEARWFVDSDHLNDDGNSRFTRMLLEDADGICGPEDSLR